MVSAQRVVYTAVMRLWWAMLCGAVALGCGHEPDAEDHAQEFLGEWNCASGQREIDCGQGVVKVDLASGIPDVIRFERGTVTNLALQVPSRVVVPGVPGGPICRLDFEALTEEAFLHAESACTDDQGERVVIVHGSANHGYRADTVYLDTDATTANGCHVKNSASCYIAH